MSFCGAAVNAGAHNCDPDLWQPTGDSAMHCYAYGGPSDPCSLNNNNDANDGLDKDPSECTMGDTFYLWDEPDTQGRSYAWAGTEWVSYATRFSAELAELRGRGFRVTTPLLRADDLASALSEFWAACGAPCDDTASPAYVDVVAVNPFCGAWNEPAGTADGCRGGVAWILNILSDELLGGRPVYVTNWAYLGSSTAAAQLPALEAIDAFFAEGSPVERVYWFGATDYGGGTTTNFLTDVVESGEHAGETLGALWQATCASLAASLPSAPPPPSPPDDAACVPDADAVCAALWDPVCGADGVTYSNSCAAHVACQAYTSGTCASPLPLPPPSAAPAPPSDAAPAPPPAAAPGANLGVVIGAAFGALVVLLLAVTGGTLAVRSRRKKISPST